MIAEKKSKTRLDRHGKQIELVGKVFVYFNLSGIGLGGGGEIRENVPRGQRR
ncbi:MAG: hypothetical protein MZV63_63510 [Marinilabiliales bacterium]|nr:hypothetical protein [Marinilabiliales bacterium]